MNQEADPLNPPPKFPLETPSAATIRGTRVKFNPTGISFFAEAMISLEKVIFVEKNTIKGTFPAGNFKQHMLILEGTQVYMKGGDIFLHHPFEDVAKKFRTFVDWQAEK